MRHILLAVAAPAVVLSAVVSPPVASQTQPDPVIARIWSVGKDSSLTERLAQVLLDSIGPRLTGTALQKSGNDWLVKTYTSWGIEAKNEGYGTWRGWRRGHSHIDLLSPRVRTLEGQMLGHSPGTGGRDLVAGTIILPLFKDSTEFVQWLPNVQGKLVLVSPPQPTCRPTQEWDSTATPASRARMEALRQAVTADWQARIRGTGRSMALGGGMLGVRLEDAGAAGIITSRPKNAWGTIEVFETLNLKAPAIGLSCEDYGLVFRLTENNQAPTLRLNLDAEILGEQPVFNTIATMKGTTKPDEYIVLSAHFDSWDGSSGATDNGTGTLTMLEAMRILKKVYPSPKRTIIAAHWAGEESGLIGSRAWTEDHPEVIRGLQGVFNQDNGTGRVVRMGGGGLPNAGKRLQEWLGKLPAELTAQITYTGVGTPSGGGSDGASFACYGAPAFGLSGLGWNYGNYTWHTNRDTYDKVVFDDLKSNASLAAMLAYLASEDATLISRERVDLKAMADSIARARAAGTPAAGGGGGGGGNPPAVWPECQKAPRVTRPRVS